MSVALHRRGTGKSILAALGLIAAFGLAACGEAPDNKSAEPPATSSGPVTEVPKSETLAQEAERRVRQAEEEARKLKAESEGGSRGLGQPRSGAEAEPGAGGAPPPPSPAPAPVIVGSPPPKPSSDKWDIVPVFYGTDRLRGPEAELVRYTGERARRLELGRALVTVPHNHKVPQIERPWTVRVPYLNIEIGETEDPNLHFTMQELKTLTQDEFIQLARERMAAASKFKKHALVFVHGFNTTFEYAIYRTAQIANDLKFDGVPFSYSWPSSNSVTPTGYNYDRESSGQSVKFLRAYLEMIVDQTGAEAVSVIAHSMGNQPTLQVLKDLRAARPNGVVFNQIILAAPDVDRDAFENIATEIKGLAKTITLYAAENDSALQASRRFNGGIARAGDVPSTGPLVISGVDTLDVTSVSTESLSLNHSGYAENNRLLDDIAKLVETGAAPIVRLPSLEVVPLGSGQYWRFPKVTQAPR
jgi:esterase/lipase superfamily enzyme